MVNEAFRSVFCAHTQQLLEILLPGARTELGLGSDMGFAAYSSVDAEKELMWRSEFTKAFRPKDDVDGGNDNDGIIGGNNNNIEAVSSLDDATLLAKPFLTKIFTNLANRHNAKHDARNNSDPHYINPDLVNLDKGEIKAAIQVSLFRSRRRDQSRLERIILNAFIVR